MKVCSERTQRSLEGVRLRLLGRGLAALVLVTGASAVRAQETAAAVRAQETVVVSPDVTLDVVLVYGSADEGAIDPGLSEMQEYLQTRLPMRFGTLEKFGSKTVELELGEPFDVPLPSGSEKVNVLPIAIVNGYLHLYLEMPGVNTRLQIKSGRPVILGGPTFKNGHMLVEITSTFSAGTPSDLDLDEIEGQPSAPSGLPSRLADRPNPSIEIENVGGESPR